MSYVSTDEELFERIRRGQTDLFGAFVRRYERELYGYLRRFLGDSDLAEDVFQNTFLAVFLKAAQFERGRPVRPWLYSVATNQAIDALRKAGRHPAVSLDQSAEPDEGTDRSLHELLQSRDAGPLDQMQGEERRRRVRECVDRLPDPLRVPLILAYYQGLKYREIAEALSIPVGTVKSRLHAALLRLQGAWAAAPSASEL